MQPPSRQVSLTGIKPTGEPHLGNLIGAIRPALELTASYDAMYFIADYHAITALRDPELVRRYSRSLAATWVAAGLDTSRVTMYRQSDVPETFELAWVLSCVTAKGLMNRAHAYKAARDKNGAAGKADLDAGINMGLYNYPVLMAADILLMRSDVVPVGRDQSQHVEYAADIAAAFNNLYGQRCQLTIPRPVLPAADASKTLPGTDGRKMSKSYGNTIPVFASEAELRKAVRRIATDSTPVDAPKDPDSSSAFQILEQFAPGDVVAETRKRLADGGMGWGELKDLLYGTLNTHLAPMRARYDHLIEPGSDLDQLLAEGASRARSTARDVLTGVRSAVGTS